MPKMHYPEIDQLRKLYEEYGMSVNADNSQWLNGKSYYPLVQFQIASHSFQLFIDDEHDDFRLNYPLLNCCLVLRELEGYAYAPAYEVWCQERFLDPEDATVRHNHQQLAKVFTSVKQILGTIDSYVSDYDFELNAGAAQALRSQPFVSEG